MNLTLLSITAVIWSHRGGAVRLPKMPLRERVKVTKRASLTLLMPVIVLGGIYTGIFTPTEAAAISCVYALLLAVFARGMRGPALMKTIMESTKTVAMVVVILGGATALGKCVVMTGVTESLVNAVAAASLSSWVVVAAMIGIILILGCFLDGSALAFLTIPVFYPIIVSFGLSPIWFAVLFVVAADVGALTPPVGVNLFVLQQIADIDLMDVVRGAIPFMIALIVGILLIALFPVLSTWLPSIM